MPDINTTKIIFFLKEKYGCDKDDGLMNIDEVDVFDAIDGEFFFLCLSQFSNSNRF